MIRTSPRKKHAAKVSLITSLVFHALVIGLLAWFAAREGFFGQQLKTIAVSMAPREKPKEPEKAKEPEKKPEPPPEPPKTQPAQPPVNPPPRPANPTPNIPRATAPPAAAPPPSALPSFNFSDGARPVDLTADPVQLYRGYVEFSLRSRWMRPEGPDDSERVAEVEIEIDPSGRITGSQWKRGSGDAAWDESVRKVIRSTPDIGRKPPKDFPNRFLVRFDVVAEQAVSETP